MTDRPQSPPVSFEDEPLILVDGDDRDLGFVAKAEAHRSPGRLHRALSVFVFRSDGALLLQRRSAQKPLWPGFWSNSCCSHPRRGETVESAAHRRVREELGLTVPLDPVFSFEYRAAFEDRGVEHELCHVLVGCSDDAPMLHEAEASASRYVHGDELDRELATSAESYTPWLRLEWERLRRDHAATLTRLHVRG